MHANHVGGEAGIMEKFWVWTGELEDSRWARLLLSLSLSSGLLIEAQLVTMAWCVGGLIWDFQQIPHADS